MSSGFLAIIEVSAAKHIDRSCTWIASIKFGRHFIFAGGGLFFCVKRSFVSARYQLGGFCIVVDLCIIQGHVLFDYLIKNYIHISYS